VPTTPLTPQQHYQHAQRLLAVAEGAHEPAADRAVAATAALVHATLAGLPKRARRQSRHRLDDKPTGGSPQTRWMLGQDENGADR
jgi:hypothetical protein